MWYKKIYSFELKNTDLKSYYPPIDENDYPKEYLDYNINLEKNIERTFYLNKYNNVVIIPDKTDRLKFRVMIEIFCVCIFLSSLVLFIFYIILK